MMVEQLYTMLLLILAVGFVVALAYYTTLLIGKKSGSFLHNGSIRVLERAGIGMQISIQVVEIGGKVYILAIQGKQVTLLDSMETEEWFQTAGQQKAKGSNMLFDPSSGLGQQLRAFLKKPSIDKGEDHNTNGQDKRNF